MNGFIEENDDEKKLPISVIEEKHTISKLVCIVCIKKLDQPPTLQKVTLHKAYNEKLALRIYECVKPFGGSNANTIASSYRETVIVDSEYGPSGLRFESQTVNETSSTELVLRNYLCRHNHATIVLHFQYKEILE